MSKNSILISAAGAIGAFVGLIVGGIWFTAQRGGGMNAVNAADPFVLLRAFPGVRTAVTAPWSTAYLIVLAATAATVLLAVAMAFSNELTEYGQARFQTIADLKKNKLLQPVGTGLIFAKLGRPESKKRFISADWNRFPHCLVVAPTRAGKGVGYVIPNTLLFPGSTVILDVKGEIFEATSRHRLAQGDKVFRFAPFDFEHPSHRYNPLERIAALKNTDQRFTELSKLASYFLTVSEKGGATDFIVGARQLFVAAGMLAIERDKPTIGEITRILFGGGDKQVEYRARAAETKHEQAASIFLNFSGYADRTLSSYASVLDGAGLGLWQNPRIDRVTSASDFSWADVRRTPQSIYIVVNSDDIPPLAPLIRLLFGELIATMRASMPDPKEEPWPVQIILDEFDQLGHMTIVVQALKQLAGHGARVSIITQSIPGLDKIYEENDRLSIESAAGMKLFLSPNEKKTAAEVSDALGKTTKLSLSDSLSHDGKGLLKRSVSRRNEERPLMTPDDVRKLSPDKVILIPERQNPIMAERIVFYLDPFFKKIFDEQTGPLPYPAEALDLSSMRREIQDLQEQVAVLKAVKIAYPPASAAARALAAATVKEVQAAKPVAAEPDASHPAPADTAKKMADFDAKLRAKLSKS